MSTKFVCRNYNWMCKLYINDQKGCFAYIFAWRRVFLTTHLLLGKFVAIDCLAVPLFTRIRVVFCVGFSQLPRFQQDMPPGKLVNFVSPRIGLVLQECPEFAIYRMKYVEIKR